MNIKIKICGLKSLEDIKIINKYSVDYVGFVFAKSTRRVTKEKAKELISILRSDIKTVGVFVDTPYEEIESIVKYCNLDIVQMHGKEKNDECKKISVHVWKGISIKSEENLNFAKIYKDVDGILLDGAKAGTGKMFNWNLARKFSKEYFTILAGGLNYHNVQEAIKITLPNVVDVSSGVEKDGKKNEEKIKKFIRKVKEYEIK